MMASQELAMRNTVAQQKQIMRFMPLEIAGYPHYENACSNFLAFFFDPEGPHGLENLFLRSLMDSVGAAGADEGGFGGNVSVEREVHTAEGNRIDILITSDSRAVLIENKIFAAVANPFEDYSDHLDRLKNADGDPYGAGRRSCSRCNPPARAPSGDSSTSPTRSSRARYAPRWATTSPRRTPAT
jgi:PD-(D/E)XK nuclease superfamily